MRRPTATTDPDRHARYAPDTGIDRSRRHDTPLGAGHGALRCHRDRLRRAVGSRPSSVVIIKAHSVACCSPTGLACAVEIVYNAFGARPGFSLQSPTWSGAVSIIPDAKILPIRTRALGAGRAGDRRSRAWCAECRMPSPRRSAGPRTRGGDGNDDDDVVAVRRRRATPASGRQERSGQEQDTASGASLDGHCLADQRPNVTSVRRQSAARRARTTRSKPP
jgi:hypothetical protein